MASQEKSREEVVTVGGWFIFYIILVIPLVGFIYLLWNVISSNANKNKQNLCRAALLWTLLVLIGSGVLIGMTGLGLNALMKSPGFNDLGIQIEENGEVTDSEVMLKQVDSKESDQKGTTDVRVERRLDGVHRN